MIAMGVAAVKGFVSEDARRRRGVEVCIPNPFGPAGYFGGVLWRLGTCWYLAHPRV